MSLLQKASIITTPTAYAEDYLYSIKPAYALGSELVTNGDFSDGTNNWTPNANATLSVENGRLKVAISGAGSGYPLQDITTEVGKKYKITANAFIGTATKVSLYSAVFGFNDLLADGSYDITFEATSTSTQIRLYVYGDGNYGFWDNISVKEVTDADFDFDRNSTGTRVNEDYLIEDVPYNFVSYSEDFTDSSWNKSDNATATLSNVSFPNGELTPFLVDLSDTSGTTSVGSRLFKYTTFKTGVQLTLSFYARSVSGTGTFPYAYYSSSVSTYKKYYAALTEDWKRYTFTFTSDFNNFPFGFTRRGDTHTETLTSAYITGVQIVKGDQPKEYLKTTDRLDIPRIDYTNGEPSILLEPSRSNIIIYSQDYTQWSSSLSPTVTSNFAISPEGITNADKITASHNNSSKFIGFTLATSTVHTASVFLKNIDSTQTRIEVYAASWSYPNFEISWNGYIPSTLSSNNVSNIQYQEYTNNWWRVSYQFTTDSSITSYNTYIYPDRVNASKSILAFGSQLEAGNNATSLIHTSGSTATRSKDSFPNPLGANGTPTGNKAVIYLEIASTPTTPLPQKNFIGFVNGTTNQYGLYHWGSTDSNKFGFNTWNGDAYGITGADYLINGEFNKIAGLFDFTNFTNNKLYINGKKQSISQVRNTTVQRSAAGLGITAPTANQDPVGNYKCVMMFDEELTDEELEKLTGYNNHELYMNYYNRLSYLGLVEEYNVESDINNYIL